jgi:ABC-type long-subunit fatty acid transport system fused permease/ATPase subunit
MELERHGADNPEQRIEQDIATFTTQTLNIMVGLLLQVMTLITFAAILFGITHRPELTGQTIARCTCEKLWSIAGVTGQEQASNAGFKQMLSKGREHER